MPGRQGGAGFGGAALDNAPLLLGLLGPVGAAVGLLGREFLTERRRGKEQDRLRSILQESTGGGDIAGMSLEQLANGLAQIESAGLQAPASMSDMLDYRQSEMTATRGQRDAIDMQNMQAAQAAQAADLQRRGAMGLEQYKQGEQSARSGMEYGQSAALEQYRQSQMNARSQAGILAQEQAAQAEREALGGVGMGAVPAGHTRVPMREGGVVDVPNPGTEAYARAMGPSQQATYTLQTIQQLRDDLEANGTETFGAGANKQAVLYSQMIRALGDLNNAGVLQSGELEMIQDMLPDPSAWDIGARPWGAGKVLEGIQTLEGLIVKKASEAFRTSPVGVLGGDLPIEWVEALRRREINQEKAPAIPPGFSVVP